MTSEGTSKHVPNSSVFVSLLFVSETDPFCFFQTLINSWRSEPKRQTLCLPRPEPPLLTPHVPPAVPIRRPNGRRTPSLPCRLVVRASLQVVLGISPPEQTLPSLVSSSTGSGVASDLHLLVLFSPRSLKPTEVKDVYRTLCCVTFCYKWMY